MTNDKMPHIQLPAGLGIRYAILPGDPGRVDRVVERMENVEFLAFNREYKSLRGTFGGVPMLVMSTGMGGPSAAIGLEELKKTGVRAAIRIGSCGSLSLSVKPGELVLVNGAVREEGTSAGYVPAGFPAVPDFDLLRACADSAGQLSIPAHIGLCRSHDCLYGDDNPRIYGEWSARGVLASDMETAALFVVGAIRGVKTASILNVVSGWKTKTEEGIAGYADGDATAAAGERNEILTALTALERIDMQMRREKSNE